MKRTFCLLLCLCLMGCEGFFVKHKHIKRHSVRKTTRVTHSDPARQAIINNLKEISQ